jgi:hypothetical protein
MIWREVIATPMPLEATMPNHLSLDRLSMTSDNSPVADSRR